MAPLIELGWLEHLLSAGNLAVCRFYYFAQEVSPGSEVKNGASPRC